MDKKVGICSEIISFNYESSLHSTFLLCAMVIFLLEMDQNRNSSLEKSEDFYSQMTIIFPYLSKVLKSLSFSLRN